MISCYLAQFKTFFMKSKEISNILTKKYDNDRFSKWFRNSKNATEVWKLWDCHYLKISCVKAVVKIWMSFEHFIMYDAYKNIFDGVSKSWDVYG
jgi:hypothetical protein